MAGNATYEIFTLIPENPVPETPVLNLPTNTLYKCCGDQALKVLATDENNNEYENDKSGFIYWFNPVVSAAEITLWKFENGAYAQVEVLDNNDFGTFYEYGFFENVEGEKFIGYQLEWKLVFEEHGAGSYIIKCNVTLSFGGSGEKVSNEFCLKKYTPARANGTVRLEYYLNGITGDIDFDEKIKNFGELNWYNSMRLPGVFGYPGSEYETINTIYNNGEQPYVEDDMRQEFILNLKQLPYFVHNILKTDFMMADTMLITDYNANNNSGFVKKRVNKKSGYQPGWSILKSNLAPVDLKFEPYYNNNKKLRN